MFHFVALLVPLLHNQVSANAVVSYTQNQGGNQLYFPWQSSGGVVGVDSADIDIATYNVKCEVYKDHQPVMRLYTEDGILLEAALMLSTVDQSQACDSTRLETFIVPRPPDGDKIVILYVYYLQSSSIMSKQLVCLERSYKVTRNLVIAEVERMNDGMVNCPNKQDQYIRNNKDLTRSGGVAELTEAKERFEVPYRLSQGVEIVGFPRADFKGKTFKLICGEHDTDKGSTVMLGSVIHGDHAGIVLENFEMKSCSLEHINVNRRIVNKEDHFKTVFKKTDGTCEEREYKFGEDKPYSFYNRLTIERSEQKIVPCPSSFEGDIGVNAFVPWYIRLLRIILFFLFKAEPYGKEI